MPPRVIQVNEVLTDTATIASGGSLSAGVRVPNGYELCAVVMPAAWTAANLTFQCSADASAYANAYDDGGNEYTVTAAASQYYSIPEGELRGTLALKVRSGVAATPREPGCGPHHRPRLQARMTLAPR